MDEMRSSDPVGFVDEVGRAVEAHGLRAVEVQLPAVVEVARRHGVSPVLLAVLGDVREPDVARVRALGRIGAALQRRPAVPAPVEVPAPAPARALVAVA